MAKVYDNATDLITFARNSTATYLDSSGVIQSAAVDTPRIEYGSDGSLKGLLIEEQRTNLVTHSEDFTNASWIKNNGSITAGATTAPSGGLADQYVEDTSDSYHRVAASTSVTSGVTYTLSVLAKYSGRQYLVMNAQALFNARSIFDIQAGTVASTPLGTATIDDMGNGWFRCSITATAPSSHTSTQFYIGTNTSAADTAYLGDGTSGVYLYGAQLEEGSFATSYIPTSGSQQTRSADVASIPVTAFGYNQDAGTVVVEVNLANRGNSDTISEGIASLKGSGAVENIGLYHVSWAAPGQIQWDVRSSNSAQAAFSPTTAANVTTIAYAFAENSFNIAVNGIAETEDTSGTVPSGITDIIFGSIYSAGDFPLNGHIKSIKYYPRRLTDDQLVELTS